LGLKLNDYSTDFHYSQVCAAHTMRNCKGRYNTQRTT